eukprot:TRINITY_DN6422_c0_g1_i7.p1 TRINITY_DN6422_c0_g1~~TRINITY_DN6422_c0_g1_i7.p1  ORF type:complete len:592 (-),score=81.71 TRINITY_DN6422_c0_g1_i7:134-1909(-)
MGGNCSKPSGSKPINNGLNMDFDESGESVNLLDLCPMLQYSQSFDLGYIYILITGKHRHVFGTERESRSLYKNEFQRYETHQPGRILENITNCSARILRYNCKILFAGEMKAFISHNRMVTVVHRFLSNPNESSLAAAQRCLIIPIKPIWENKYHKKATNKLNNEFCQMLKYCKWDDAMKTIKCYKDSRREVLVSFNKRVRMYPIFVLFDKCGYNTGMPMKVLRAMYDMLTDEEKLDMVNSIGTTIPMGLARWINGLPIDFIADVLDDVTDDGFVKQNRHESNIASGLVDAMSPRGQKTSAVQNLVLRTVKRMPLMAKRAIIGNESLLMYVLGLRSLCPDLPMLLMNDLTQADVEFTAPEEDYFEIMDIMDTPYTALSMALRNSRQREGAEVIIHRILDKISTKHLLETNIGKNRTYLWDALNGPNPCPSVLKRLLETTPFEWIQRFDPKSTLNPLQEIIRHPDPSIVDAIRVVYEFNRSWAKAMDVNGQTPAMMYFANSSCRTKAHIMLFLMLNDGLSSRFSRNDTEKLKSVTFALVKQQLIMGLILLDEITHNNIYLTDETVLDILPWIGVDYGNATTSTIKKNILDLL